MSAWLLVALLAGAAAPPRSLAVLEPRNKLKAADQDNVDAGYFADVVRTAALEAGRGSLKVMTRENMLVLLQASGKKLDDCEGECEVDTGRRLGADLIVSGELLRIGTLFKLDLRLHDTRDGTLLSGAQASGATVDELDQAMAPAVRKLLAVVTPAQAAPAAPAPQRATPAPASAACPSAQACTSRGNARYEEAPAQALPYYLRGCELGAGHACSRLGMMFHAGQGTAKDPARSRAFSRRGCELGNGAACNNFGISLQEGEGGTLDLAKACSAYEKACSLGNANGCDGVGACAERGQGGFRRDPAKAVGFYTKACEGKCGAGCGNLAALVRAGRGVKRNAARAARLDQQACALGFERSCKRRR